MLFQALCVVVLLAFFVTGCQSSSTERGYDGPNPLAPSPNVEIRLDPIAYQFQPSDALASRTFRVKGNTSPSDRKVQLMKQVALASGSSEQQPCQATDPCGSYKVSDDEITWIPPSHRPNKQDGDYAGAYRVRLRVSVGTNYADGRIEMLH